MPYVYCRPHVKTITPQMRFIVRTNRGVTVTGGRTFTLTVDTFNMVHGSTNDELELKIKTKALTGGAERIAYYAYFVGAQDTPIMI